MRSTSLVTAAVAVTATGSVLLASSPSQGTRAQWSASATTSVTGPSSDGFAITAEDVPNAGTVPVETGGVVWPAGRLHNSPQVTLTNQSTRHSSWINVTSARVTTAIATDGGADLLSRMALDYTVGTGSCQGGGQDQYWRVRGFGELSNGTTYDRDQSKVGSATLPPGQARVLCPKVTLNYPGTPAGQRSALLNHAGRALDITTVVNQRSEAPASWASPDRTVTSRFRMAMPTPVKPSEFNVCRTTNSSGNPNALVRLYGGFFWGWPDAPTSSTTPTPAMAGGWDIMRRSPSGEWETWRSVSSGSNRALAGINSNDIDNDPFVIRQFKLRGYPFAGDKSRYIESAWIARASDGWGLNVNRWVCHEPLLNPNAGPHNMP